MKERLEIIKKGQKKEENPEKKSGNNQGDGQQQEKEKEGGGNQQGQDQKGKMTVVKIKTKDGQEFQMNIKGEVESIEMKGEEEGKKGGEGKEKEGSNQNQGG